MSWSGPEATLIRGWLHMDGDGDSGPSEQVLARQIEGGISVVEFFVPKLPGQTHELALEAPTGDRCELMVRVPDLQATAAGWQEGFFVSDLDDSAASFVVYDDGGGPDLYAAGDFVMAGGLPANGIARWDGAEWSNIGAGAALTNWDDTGRVWSLAVYDDGGGPCLWAGGTFSTAGGVPAAHVACWDGTVWGTAGTGINDQVRALRSYDDGSGSALYAAGLFTIAGGGFASNIARWDGAAWSEPGDGISGSVYALETFDDGTGSTLFAGGWFSSAGGVSASDLAKWDGVAWSEVGGGVQSGVWSLEAFDDGTGSALFVGGRFKTAGGVTANRIARWNGSSWQTLSGPLGTGMIGHQISAIAGYASDRQSLFVGGQSIYAAGGLASSRIGRWRSGGVYTDGFESGDTSNWSVTTP